MYKVVYKVPEHPSSVEIKKFSTFRESVFFANKFAEGMIIEIKWYSQE